MSETQDVSSVVESSESSDTEITRQNSEIDEEREDSEQQDTRRSETPKSECPSTPSDEPAQNANGAVPDAERSPPPSPATPPPQQKPPSSSPPPPSEPAAEPQAQKQQQQSSPAQPQQPRQPSRTGECNLLPVLVERLRSALELSCSSQSSEDQLPLEDSGVDSEEDFRLWSSGITGSPHQPSLNGGSHPHGELATGKPKLDLKFLEDILLADIHTALARLQDTLKRVDIGTLTRYNASLDPSNKLYLLRLISSLLAKLKVPDEALAQQEYELPNGRPAHFGPRRRKNERHTVSVTSDELAQARRWFDDKSVSSSESSPKVDIERIVEGAPSLRLDSESAAALQAERSELVNAQPPAVSYERNGYNDKYMKDVINQQQSLQIRNNREYQNELPGKVYEHEGVGQTPRRAESHSKDDSAALRQQQDHKSASFHYHQQHPSTPLKHNKYTSKKSKIKRANTIDIPSYLKLKSDSPDHFHHGCFALRRPIDIGDRSFNVPQRVIPDFEPKTDNDRKFLALINRNTESGSSGASSPFKSFNYRQSSTVADKNWNSRFSNIKTTFDKPREDGAELQRKPGKLDIRKKFENISNDNLDREVSQAYKLPYGSPKPKHNGFTHAPTSPFQKIEKSSPKPDTAPAFLKSGYLPKNSSMLQAKVKLFDQESSKSSLQNNNADASSTSTSRAKNKFGKPPENSYIVPQPVNKCAQQKKPSTQATENGHNYYSFCKQFAPFASGKSNSTEGKSAIDSAKSKFLENLSDESDHVELRRSKPKSNYQDPKMSVPRADPHDNRHNAPRQYQKLNDAHVFNQYQEPVKNYQNIQSYLQLEKKPQFNYPLKTYKDEEPSSYAKPEVPPKKSEAPTQSVAVQTSLESTDRRLPEADLVNCTANLSQDHSIYQPKKLLNVSVQTTSPSIVTPAQRTSQSLCHTSTSPSIVSPIPHANQAIVEQTQVPTMPAATQYPTYPYPVNQVPQNYYNPSSLTDQDYHRADDFSYSSQPYSQEVHEIFKPPIKNVVPLKPTKEPCSGISQKLYNEFSKLPATNQMSRRFSDQDDYRRHDSSLFSPVNPAYHEAKTNKDSEDKILRSEPIYEEKKLPPSEDLLEENIENQDISPDGVVTRYTCAIATVSSAPEEVSEATESLSSYPSQPYEPVVTRIKEPQQRHFAETTSVPVPAERKIDSGTSYDEIQRHNLLQQALMRRMQSEQQFAENMAPRRLSQEVAPKESQSGQSPTFNGTSSSPGQINALKALTESHKAQDRINFFEEKRLNNKQLFRPLNVGAKVNVVPPTTVAQQSERAASMRNNASPIDSSDEYLMSCASKPSRHLVLSKSESWHQLAMARGLGGGLQVPGQQPGGPGQLKPPKPKSPASLRLSKQFEASLGTDNARKMEEKIQRYFQRPGPAGAAAHIEEPASRAQPKQQLQQQTSKRESKSKRVLQSKRTTSNSLARSATMPHLYDDRLFDDSVDVDKAFDSIFKEATRTDNRH